MNRARNWWMAIGAAIILASVPMRVSPAAASSSGPGGLSTAEGHALPVGVHTPSAAERRALPASLRSVAAAISYPVYVWNNRSVKCMEVYGGATANGSKVDQWTCNRTSHQKWTFIAVGDFNVRWLAVNVKSGRCLDTTNNHADGVQMTIWSCSSSNANQLFYRFATDSTGYRWTLRPQWGTTKCVEVYHSSLLNGAIVDHYACNGTQTQVWSQSQA